MRKSPEEAVTRVLAGLRDAEPPAGMERRILEAVHNRASVKSTSAWHRLRPMWLIPSFTRWSTQPRIWGVGLVCAAAIFLAVSMIHRTQHIPTSAIPANVADARATIDAQHPHSPKEIATTAQFASPTPSRRSTRRTYLRRTALIPDTDSQALREMRASNHPAPPMPLTEQEKLLLRIAHKRAPEELAELNPVQRDARDAQQKAEVQKFFEPAPTRNNE